MLVQGVCFVDGLVLHIYQTHYVPTGHNQVDDSSDSDSDGGGDHGQLIGIAVVVVLLLVAIACIVGLVIWIIKLH